MSNNLLSVVIGASMIATCFVIAYLFQKNVFGRYRNKVKSASEIADQQS